MPHNFERPAKQREAHLAKRQFLACNSYFLLRGYRAYKFRPQEKLSHPKNRLTFREAVGGSLVEKEKNLAAAGLWPWGLAAGRNL